jgi:flagellar hook-associated protein 3 FlgL
MVTRNYTKGLNENRGLLDRYSRQVYDGRRFYTMSEDPSSGVRAMQVRRNLLRIDAYLDNVSSAQSHLGAAESALMEVSDVNQSVGELFVSGINGDKGPAEREIVATQIEKLRDELLALGNTNFAGRYVFGGSNTVTQPFTLDPEGNLLYNNVDVRGINGNHELLNDAAYMDVGVGVTFNDTGDAQKVDPNTAHKYTLVGVDFFGTGNDNIYRVMNDMIDSLRAPVFDPEAAGEVLDRFRESAAGVNVELTKLGADSQYLEFTKDRLDTEKINLTSRQKDIEGIDADEAIMNFKMQEYVYNATLQMGQRLLQPTLFSFIN